MVRITKKEYIALGQCALTGLYRKQRNDGFWSYWINPDAAFPLKSQDLRAALKWDKHFKALHANDHGKPYTVASAKRAIRLEIARAIRDIVGTGNVSYLMVLSIESKITKGVQSAKV